MTGNPSPVANHSGIAHGELGTDAIAKAKFYRAAVFPSYTRMCDESKMGDAIF